MAARSGWLATGIVIAASIAGFVMLRDRLGPAPDAAPATRRDLPAGVDGPSPAATPTRTDEPAAARNERLPHGHGTDESPVDAAAAIAPKADGGSEEARHLVERMGRLIRDLEYTPGLREPVQQTVTPQPEPWRPDPVREGPPPELEEITPRRIRAAGGDRVTIRGRNLRVVQVMFGNVPARLLAASGTVVAVEAPASSVGPVTIAVTNDDGTWAVSETPLDSVP